MLADLAAKVAAFYEIDESEVTQWHFDNYLYDLELRLIDEAYDRRR